LIYFERTIANIEQYKVDSNTCMVIVQLLVRSCFKLRVNTFNKLSMAKPTYRIHYF